MILKFLQFICYCQVSTHTSVATNRFNTVHCQEHFRYRIIFSMYYWHFGKFLKLVCSNCLRLRDIYRTFSLKYPIVSPSEIAYWYNMNAVTHCWCAFGIFAVSAKRGNNYRVVCPIVHCEPKNRTLDFCL